MPHYIIFNDIQESDDDTFSGKFGTIFASSEIDALEKWEGKPIWSVKDGIWWVSEFEKFDFKIFKQQGQWVEIND